MLNLDEAQKFSDRIQSVEEALNTGDAVAVIQAIKCLQPYIRKHFELGQRHINWFTATDSDADGFPTGPERCHWNAEALASSDKRLKEVFDDLFKETHTHLETLKSDVQKITPFNKHN